MYKCMYTGAISMANNKAIINRTKCTECEKCYQVCPEGAIYSELQSQYNISQSQGKGFYNSGFGMDRGMGRGLGKGRGKGLEKVLATGEAEVEVEEEEDNKVLKVIDCIQTVDSIFKEDYGILL